MSAVVVIHPLSHEPLVRTLGRIGIAGYRAKTVRWKHGLLNIATAPVPVLTEVVEIKGSSVERMWQWLV